MSYFINLLIIFIISRLAFSFDVVNDEDYNENLIVKQLPDGQVYFHFEFKTVLHNDLLNINWANHFNLFPLSIGKLISKHQIQEFHFSLTKGLWKHKRWGYPVRDAPTGAELWVWFQQFHINPAKSWKDVTSELSGQFCASVNFIDNSVTVQPKYSFRPEGVINGQSLNNDSVFYASLPHEAVCTENLTPWKKLLPCFGKKGLASLLNSGHVFNTFYHSIAIDFRPICRDSLCKSSSVELVQSISLVFNPPIMFDGKPSWSLIKLFGASISKTCSLANDTMVYVDITNTNENNPVKLQPSPSRKMTKNYAGEQRTFAVFDVKELLMNLDKTKPTLNIGSYYQKNFEYSSFPSPPLYANRFIKGFGLLQGGITCNIYNQLNFPVEIAYLDIVPWYLRMYVHTLRIVLNNGTEIKPHSIFYKPAKDRIQSHHLELLLVLPGKSSIEITYEFGRAFLKWTEYPPDAFHGVYVDSSVISAVLKTGLNLTSLPVVKFGFNSYGYFIRIHTETLLVSLPTPDFSMPYNVICLVSTVVSLAFGPIHNLTTRRAKVLNPDEKKGFLTKLKNKLKSLFGKKENETNEQDKNKDE